MYVYTCISFTNVLLKLYSEYESEEEDTGMENTGTVCPSTKAVFYTFHRNWKFVQEFVF